jgi:hypothetical protein
VEGDERRRKRISGVTCPPGRGDSYGETVD